MYCIGVLSYWKFSLGITYRCVILLTVFTGNKSDSNMEWLTFKYLTICELYCEETGLQSARLREHTDKPRHLIRMTGAIKFFSGWEKMYSTWKPRIIFLLPEFIKSCKLWLVLAIFSLYFVEFFVQKYSFETKLQGRILFLDIFLYHSIGDCS